MVCPILLVVIVRVVLFFVVFLLLILLVSAPKILDALRVKREDMLDEFVGAPRATA